MSGLCNIYNSGYKGLYGDKTYTGCDGVTEANTIGLDLPSTRYYESYANNTTYWYKDTNYLGEALVETRSWYQDYSYFVSASNPWSVRGGNFSIGVSADGFNTSNDHDCAYGSVPFCAVVMNCKIESHKYFKVKKQINKNY